MVADRFFSKDSLTNSIISIISSKKKYRILKKFRKQNHFSSMFNYYYKMRSSKELNINYAIELENHQKLYLNKIPYKL